MKQYQGYLLDLDGTTYYGPNRIPTAEVFINQLIDQGIPIQFVTNNATQSVDQIAHKLQTQFGIHCEASMIYTSTLALLDYLKANHADARVYVVGEEALHQQVEAAGFVIEQTPDASVVVQGLNRHTTYEELEGAVQAILNGAAFLVTNTDNLIPTQSGLSPSSGALTAFIQYATNCEPIVFGKPHAPILEGAVQRLGIPREELLLIGDNYQTDILAGIHAGIDTLLVLTGVTQADEVASLPEAPTYVVDDLSQWRI